MLLFEQPSWFPWKLCWWGTSWRGQVPLCWEKKTASLSENAVLPSKTGGSRLFPAKFSKEARELALDFPLMGGETQRVKGFPRNGGGWFSEHQVKKPKEWARGSGLG